MTLRVLVVDDDPEMNALLRDRLSRRGLEVSLASSTDEALERLAAEAFDVVVTDVRLKGASGLELCERVAADRPSVPVVVITAFGSLETAVEAIRAGAHDFLAKPFEIEELAFRIHKALQHRRLSEEVKRLREDARQNEPDGELLGESGEMRALRDLIGRVAQSDASVLITGETGCGKELVARAIHRHGPRKSGPFVAVNCAALPETLLESELFGHVRGAFTDAREAREGLIAHARGGTLFLDEIADMPASLQPKLLRALQDRCVRPLGASAEVPIDIRIVAATHQDLDAAIEEGRFREDLLFRIDVLRVEVPPLRARGNDVLLLAQEFIRALAKRTGKPVLGLSRGAAEKLLAYSWPGNVRELQNCIERAIALTRHEEILIEDLPARIGEHTRRDVLVVGDDPSELAPLAAVEERYIARVLESTGGNKARAARILGLDRKTLYRKLERRQDSREDEG
jgi:two-component system response regulator HydG